MSLQCQKIEIKKLPFYASDITNFTSAVCAVVLEMSSVWGGEPIFESWANTYSGDLYSSYTTVLNFSSSWVNTDDPNVNSFVYSNSANILAVDSLVNTNSGNWNSVYNSYNSSSGSFLTYSSADVRYVKLSGDVMTGGLSSPSLSTNNLYVAGSTINFFNESGNIIETLKSNDVENFKSNYTLTNSRSANWEEVYLEFSSQSANNSSVYNTVQTNSGSWNYQGTDIKSLTSNWENTYTNFSVQSANNISIYNTFNSNSGNYNSTYNTVQTYSAAWIVDSTVDVGVRALTSNWENTYNTVQNNSAINWNYQGTDIKSLTSNWEDTYVTVETYSGNWTQILSFNESTAELSISNGNTISLSSLSSIGGNVNNEYLPLSGGILTGDLYINADIASVDSIQFNLTAGATVGVGGITWNATDSTFDMGVSHDVTLQVGQETLVQVKNSSSAIIYNGTPVFASGASGGGSGNITVSAYRAGVADPDDLYFLGIATQELPINDFGFITTFGKVRGVVVSEVKDSSDSSAWPIGTILYPSATELGKLTSVKPTAPNKGLPIVMIISVNGNQRTFFVRAEHGYSLDELQNVEVPTPSNGQVLLYNSTSGIWINSEENDPKFTTWAQSYSSNYQNTFNTVQTYSSLEWNYQGTDIKALTANWDATYNNFSVQSGNNLSVYSQVNTKSANWDSSYNTVNTYSSTTWNYQGNDIKALTANWDATFTQFSTQSSNNLSVYSQVNTNSSNWDSSYTTVNTYSSTTWNYQGTDIKALTANWQSSYTSLTSTSGNWDSAYTQVNSKSANWDSVYTNVNSNSANAFIKASIGITIDGGGSAITTGSKGSISIPYNCIITNNTLIADQSGSIVVDIKKATYSGFPTTASICAAAKPTLSSAQKSTDSTLTGWTTTVNAGDVIEYVVDSASTVTRVTLTLGVNKFT